MSIALFPHGRRACFALSPLRRWFSTNIAPNNDTQQAKEITQDTSKVVPGIRDDSSSQSQEALSPAAQRLLDVFHQSDSQSVAGDGTPRVTDKDRAEASIPTYLKPEYNALSLVLVAVENCKPLMKVISNKQGTRVAYTPRLVSLNEQRSLAVRWILDAARKRKDSNPAGKRLSMAECVAIELMLAARKKGAAREKRDALHTLAIENKANLLRGSG